MSKSLRVFAVLSLMPALAAAPAPPPLRQPIKPWNLDYGETACTALRAYGSEAAPVTLAFRPSPNGTVVRLIIVRPGRVESAYQFGVTTNISAAAVKTTGLRFGTKDNKTEIIWINFARPDLEGLRRAGEIAIRGGSIDERFALPGIGAVLDGLDTCNADLRRYWNVDDTAALKQPAKPLKSLAAYFSDSDYPAQAVQEGASGTSKIMLMVDESGAVKDCLVEETSGMATLDAMTCLVLQQRAKFHPALDSAKKPVRSVLTTKVIWRMP